MSRAKHSSIYWEDVKDTGETVIGTATVSKEEIIEYSSRYDPHDFHIDEDAARHTHYGGIIASGFHTCSLVTRVMCDAYLLESANLGSPGIDELRWPNPVRPGDVLTVKRTVLESRPTSKPDRGLLKFLISAENQKGETVLTMKLVNIFKRRGQSYDGAPPRGGAEGDDDSAAGPARPAG
jgi:acyl dehydratase